METKEKEKIAAINYAPADLAGKTIPELTAILEARDIKPHHNAKEDKLMSYIITTNPVSKTQPGSVPAVTTASATSEATKKEEHPEDNRTDNDFVDQFKNLSQPVKKENVLPEKPNKGIVVIEIIDPKRTGSITVRDYTDLDGEPRKLVDARGAARVVTIKNKNVKLDLSKENDRLLYEHIKDHPVYILGGYPCLRLVNTELQAQKHIDRTEMGIDAKSLIKGLGEENLRDLSRLLDISFNATTTINVLKQLLYQKAELEPESVINAWNHPDREMRILVYRGIDKSVIAKRNGVYYMGEVSFGTSFEECIQFLKQHEDLLPNLRARNLAA
jgi:hypothetical protein